MTQEPPAATPVRSRRRRAWLGIGLASVVMASVGVAVTSHLRGDDPVTDAVAIAGSDDGYGTGLEAGRTLARTASALNRAIVTCDRVAEPERCAALGAASGYIQVVAATVVHCTAPGREEARRSVRSVLEELRTAGPGHPTPALPPIPECRT
ncbi:MAG TPA: hypothetical protein VM143_10000 [Acidimicrobiales bacterium]|nr:hypothetical protein [Acidimicrobiales bacterium]